MVLLHVEPPGHLSPFRYPGNRASHGSHSAETALLLHPLSSLYKFHPPAQSSVQNSHPREDESRYREMEERCSVTFSVEVGPEEEPRRTLDACFRCRGLLVISSDVFMYRGDTPFCSEDCRQEQIDLDGARERELRHRRGIHHRRGASLLAASAASRHKAAVVG